MFDRKLPYNFIMKKMIAIFDLYDDSDIEDQVKTYLADRFQSPFEMLDQNEFQYTIHIEYMSVPQMQSIKVIIQLEADDDAWVLWCLSTPEG